MADLHPIRLLKPYRSSRPGDVLQATPNLAARLIELGIACEYIPEAAAARPQLAERAVAPGPREVR